MIRRRRQWQATPVLLPRKSHGWRSLVGCSPWDRYESVVTEWLHFHFSLSCNGEGNGNPLQCSCLENPRDGKSLAGCCLWGHTESDTTEATEQQQQQQWSELRFHTSWTLWIISVWKPPSKVDWRGIAAGRMENISAVTNLKSLYIINMINQDSTPKIDIIPLLLKCMPWN